MPTENERKDVQKSMAYDLIHLLERNPEKTYTVQELKELIDTYIQGTQQKRQSSIKKGRSPPASQSNAHPPHIKKGRTFIVYPPSWKKSRR